MNNDIKEVAKLLVNSKSAIAFTGAGISVESNIPPFRGENGLWNKYDPKYLELNYFHTHPAECWKIIKEIFYDFFGSAKPNAAHIALAELEKMNIIKAVVTQNIDNLHFDAGNKNIFEFHGNSRNLVCLDCGKKYSTEIISEKGMPLCKKCDGVLKPDFIFFGEQIPEPAGSSSFDFAKKSDIVIIIGSTGEVVPASHVPVLAKQSGAKIIEVNISKTNFTSQMTDIFLEGKASEVMTELLKEINLLKNS
ncbi:MAG: NAD-dependent deacylase [Bacteroidota bacterium]|nr:NAD-dependent deacylase [Bacteroidota bacterium]